MIPATAVYATLPVLALFLCYRLFVRKRRPGEPPIVPGHIIWGNGASFAQDAVSFLQTCQKKFGNVFTIRLLNYHMTILMDHRDFELLSKERNFDFDPIQKQVNWNVFHFVLKDPRKMMKETGKWVKGKSLVKSLSNFITNLTLAFEKMTQPVVETDNKTCRQTQLKSTDGYLCKHLDASIATTEGSPWTQTGLRIFASQTVFASIFNTIFGQSGESSFDFNKAFVNFDVFHKYFNFFWLGLPKMLFPEALKALEQLLTFPEAEELLDREDLSDYVRNAIYYMRTSGQTNADIKGHNLVFLHVNYNVFRISFWLLYYMLANEGAVTALREEMKDIFETNYDSETNSVNLTLKDVENMDILGSIVDESFRMSSGVFMVRHVTQDTNFKSTDGNTHLIRKGDKVAIYPPAIHKNEDLFKEPENFSFDRFVKSSDEYEMSSAIMPFGSLCPGKRYAILQAKVYVLSVFSRFEFQLLPGEFTDCDRRYHGHEILPPVRDVQVKYRVLTDAPTLNISQ